jgi:protein-disulfide isomerase
MDETSQHQGGMQPGGQSNLAVPIAIVIAGIIVGASLFFTAGNNRAPVGTQDPEENTPQNLEALPPITENDHILGNPDAQIIIVEYSDLECPFCKQFHSTMKAVMAEYGAKGQVAWVYRNFPLDQLHPNASKLAEAAECVASLAGNQAYWDFLDALFLEYPINTFADMGTIGGIAAEAGADEAAFTKCWQDGTFAAKVQQEYEDAIASGGQGTPHNVVITKHGTLTTIPGAQPYTNVKQMIDAILEQGA